MLYTKFLLNYFYPHLLVLLAHSMAPKWGLPQL